MAEFDSSISRKSSKLNKFVVEEPQQQKPLTPENVLSARKEMLEGRLPKESVVRLEYLMDIGMISTKVTVGQTVFELRTLKTGEYKVITRFIKNEIKNDSELTDAELNMVVRREQLVHGLLTINGKSLSTIFDTEDDLREFLDDLSEPVVALLSQELTNLIKEANKQYGIYTEQDAEKVADDLKKS